MALTEDDYWNAATDEGRHGVYMEALAEIVRLRAGFAQCVDALQAEIEGNFGMRDMETVRRFRAMLTDEQRP